MPATTPQQAAAADFLRAVASKKKRTVTDKVQEARTRLGVQVKRIPAGADREGWARFDTEYHSPRGKARVGEDHGNAAHAGAILKAAGLCPAHGQDDACHDCHPGPCGDACEGL